MILNDNDKEEQTFTIENKSIDATDLGDIFEPRKQRVYKYEDKIFHKLWLMRTLLDQLHNDILEIETLLLIKNKGDK